MRKSDYLNRIALSARKSSSQRSIIANLLIFNPSKCAVRQLYLHLLDVHTFREVAARRKVAPMPRHATCITRIAPTDCCAIRIYSTEYRTYRQSLLRTSGPLPLFIQSLHAHPDANRWSCPTLITTLNISCAQVHICHIRIYLFTIR